LILFQTVPTKLRVNEKKKKVTKAGPTRDRKDKVTHMKIPNPS